MVRRRKNKNGTSGTGETKRGSHQIGIVSQPSKSLYPAPPKGSRTWTEALMKSAVKDNQSRSKQGAILGVKAHPFDMRNVALFSKTNPHHAASIEAKSNAVAGLGFVNEMDKVLRRNEKRAKLGLQLEVPNESIVTKTKSHAAEILDPLCEISLQVLMAHISEDLANTHNAYFEVVRRGEGETITGLHHIPAGDIHVVLEDQDHNFHFQIQTPSSNSPSTRRFARFGDKDGFIERVHEGIPSAAITDKNLQKQHISEVIHIRIPSAMNRYYGIPTWLSAVAAIELIQALHQAEFDFYNNRGVPEFLLFLLGKQLNDDEWGAVKQIFQGSIGLGNTRKSGAFNLTGEVEVQVEKLAMEGKSDGRFSEMMSALALEVVTGHRIPPLLAGIQTPGKLGANNELPNALLAYQTLVVAPDQGTIQSTLGCTLGDADTNGGLGLTYEDFELRTIMDVFDFERVDTVSRMRETEVEAAAEGRDIDKGLEKSQKLLMSDLLKGDNGPENLGRVLAAFVERASQEA